MPGIYSMKQLQIPEAETGEPQTAQAWENFIRGEVSDTDTAYLAKPGFLLGHGRGERGATRDYAGRELLELVQNAADAAAEAGMPGRVHIEITSDGLIVANTGQPFRRAGVQSLMAANTSDKQNRRIRLIGAKGLGFRALLNWSSEPFITSGELEIGFSREHAEAHASALATRSPDLAALLAGTDAVVPVLAFPRFGSAAGRTSRPGLAALITRARALRTQGYDTVVVAHFGEPDALERAIAQADEFEPQFLLFVPTLETLELRVVGRVPTIWTRQAGVGERLSLTIRRGDEVDEQVWTCRRRADRITDETGETSSYELAVAIRHGSSAAGRLHSYFPTDVSLPFPALLHATLELDSNRKALNAGSKVNSLVLGALATFYAETVTSAAKSRTHDPLALLARRAPFPAVLQSFEEAVYAAAALKKIIPTMRGTRVAAADTCLGPSGYETFFPPRLFGDLARCRSAWDRSVLEHLGVKQIEVRQALTILRSEAMSLTERAEVVLGVVKSLPKEFHDRRLLIDSEGRTLTLHNTCFTDPSSRRAPALPSWASARFIHPELWRLISAGLTGTPRMKIQQLAGFGVHEFNVDGVITSLRSQAAAVLSRGRADPDKTRRELLKAVFGLYRGAGRQSAYPAGRLDVRCADGVWRDARNVHISAPYSDQGRIVSALYATRPELLLGTSDANGLEGASEDLEGFFRWIGVQPWPKPVTEPLPTDLRPILLAALPETFEVSDGTHQDTIKRAELSWWDARVQHDTVEGLVDILSHAPSDAILAWLAADPRASQPFRTRLSARTGRKLHRSYRGPLPDLFHHRVGSVAWLETRDGGRIAPRDAMMAPGRLAELFPAPAPLREDNSFGLSPESRARGLFTAGVARGLSDLGEARIFALLGDLQKKGVSTEMVRRVYGQILELEEFDPTRAPTAAARFRRSGHLQVRQAGTVAWAPVAQTFYLDRDNIPAAARDLVPLIDLPSRRNTADVQARFGAAPLSRRKLRMTVVEKQVADGPIAAVLQRRWAATLPYIRAHRRAANADVATFKPVERLELVVCTHAILEISLEGEARLASLDPWKHVITDDALIVVIEPLVPEAELVFSAAEALGDGVAERLGLQSGSDFTRLLSAPSDAMRASQLRRMLTHRSVEEIEALMAEFEAEPVEASTHEVDAALLARALAPAPMPPIPTTAGPAASLKPPSPAAPSKAPPEPLGPVVGVTATLLPAKSPAVSGGGGGSGRGGGLRLGGATTPLGAPQDPDKPADAQSWAEFYETTDGRYPLLVARLQGKGSFGCDLLSFASASDREAFKHAPDRVELICRYIEVKSGGVRLVANEMDAALKHGPKYYVYRIRFEGDGRDAASLTLVSDPLSHGSALSRECDVRLDEIPSSLNVELRAVRGPAKTSQTA